MKYWPGRQASERNAPAQGSVAAGLTGAFGDEVFHGIFGGGTGPSGGQRAGADTRALYGGIGCRDPLCGGTAGGSLAELRTWAALRKRPKPAAVDGSLFRAPR